MVLNGAVGREWAGAKRSAAGRAMAGRRRRAGGGRSGAGTIRQVFARRFAAVWVIFAGLYVALAALGPNGVVPVPVWPRVNQHQLQVRAWLGEDIEVVGPNGEVERVVEVRPRLDVTPYLRDRVVGDPRETALLGNLACVVPAPDGGGRPMPAQQAAQRLGVAPERLAERMVCHVGFPPGPAFLLLPIHAALRGLLATQWLSALLGGLAVAVMDRLLRLWLDEVAGGGSRAMTGVLNPTVLAGLGTLWLWAAPDGGTWLFAHVVAACGLAVALLLAWHGRAFACGLAFALAISARPPVLLALPLLVAMVVGRTSRGVRGRGRRSGALRALALTALPVLVAGGVALALNQLRFGSPFDFGYAAMITPPHLSQRLAEHGQFSLDYLGRNLRYLFVEPPRLLARFPFAVSDPQGMGLLFVTPAFVAVLAAVRSAGRGRRLVAAAWASLIAVTVPALLYFNTGWVQWGGRFLLDGWPLWLLLAAIGLQRLDRRLAVALVLLSVASNLWAVVATLSRAWPGCVM